ncbi:hypothetical protein K488DRAFT_68284 [Vararia minispora EC-137]|uniref:Uncharacterized protein n=1 Tax=Vararia minispora EC-137 TaxID=1314806 RepID=A0ACB8QVM1_9AGAM|nr:hypothetical protein K488DRAFT_68284 [Vararia minispora EC-137]
MPPRYMGANRMGYLKFLFRLLRLAWDKFSALLRMGCAKLFGWAYRQKHRRQPREEDTGEKGTGAEQSSITTARPSNDFSRPNIIPSTDSSGLSSTFNLASSSDTSLGSTSGSLLNTYRALLIGLNYKEQGDRALTGSVKDVMSMKTLLIKSFGWSEDEITVMTDEIDKISHDSKSAPFPTKENMLREMGILVKDARPDSNLMRDMASKLQQKMILTSSMVSTNVGDLYNRCFMLGLTRLTFLCKAFYPLSLSIFPIMILGRSLWIRCLQAAVLPHHHNATTRTALPVRSQTIHTYLAAPLRKVTARKKNHWRVLKVAIRLTARRTQAKSTRSEGELQPEPLHSARIAKGLSLLAPKKDEAIPRAILREDGPIVISLSACSDGQLANECKGGGGIMTTRLCKLLTANPDASIGEVENGLRFVAPATPNELA